MSSGAKKDFLVLCFCYALIEVSQEKIKDSTIIMRKGNYNHNKKINRALLKLHTAIKTTVDTEFKKDISLVLWVRKNLDSKIGYALTKATQSTLSLELISLFILFVNFVERSQKLDPIFDQYTKVDTYFRIIDMLNTTEAANVEGEMFQLAYELIKNIKG